MSNKASAMLAGEQSYHLERVYGPQALETIREAFDLQSTVLTTAALRTDPKGFEKVEYLFSTWGMPVLTAEDLAKLPALKAVFFAAGSVQSFARPLLERGVRVFSAWETNAVPVGEFALAQILLGSKGYFGASRRLQQGGPADWAGSEHGGNYHQVVSILGAGMTGRAVIERLQPFDLKICAYDKFLSAAQIQALGAEAVSLEDAFESSAVISNHLADNAQTKGLLNKGLFERLPQHAVFINTGRGATVNEADLWDVLGRRPDLTALLDVTKPEPPVAGSPAYSLPNVFLSPHLAGSTGKETLRLGMAMADTAQALLRGEALNNEVKLSDLETMA